MKAACVRPFVIESLGKCSSRAASPQDPDQGMGAPAPLAHRSVAGHGTMALARALVLALACPRSVCDWALLSLSPAFPPVT